MIPNPNNDFVPTVGQTVRVVGGCHPRLLGKVGRVTLVDLKARWVEFCYTNDKGEELFTGGLLGGVEPFEENEMRDPSTYYITVRFERELAEDEDMATRKFPDKDLKDALALQMAEELQEACDNGMAGMFEVETIVMPDGSGKRFGPEPII
jgi:hypothetical protein